MKTIGKLQIPADLDLDLEENNQILDDQLEIIYKTLEDYLDSAYVYTETGGIGSYEYWGVPGNDSYEYLEYDDEYEFLVEADHPELPHIWPYLETLTTTIYRDDLELNLIAKPIIQNKQYLFVLEIES